MAKKKRSKKVKVPTKIADKVINEILNGKIDERIVGPFVIRRRKNGKASKR